MKVVTPALMNEIDKIAISSYGIPGVVLMENAAIKVVDEVRQYTGIIKGKKILVFAGKGNNGGDAFAVARHLFNMEALVKVYLLALKESVESDARTNLIIIEKMGVEIIELVDDDCFDSLKEDLHGADLIIDGIFGTGLKGRIEGLTAQVINHINFSVKSVVSIDIPSGISGETGEALGTCIKATSTVTFGLPKIGLVIHEGCNYAGKLKVVDIGIPSEIIQSMNIRINLIEDEMVSNLLPVRNNNTNKGDYGKILVVSGSKGMTGAGCLTAGAALRTGAGLVYLAVPASLASVYDSVIMEAITYSLYDGGSGYLNEECIDGLMERMKRVDVVAIGPGLSNNKTITQIIDAVVENSKTPLILDADALNALSCDLNILKKLKTDAVITPHPGEMSRLAGITVEEVQKNRIDVAARFAREWNVTVVLKGSRTIIAAPHGEIYINPTGNPGMATGGTGDVLTGIIAGLAGQGLKLVDAAIAGVYLHGLAGDMAAGDKGQHGLIARDLVEVLPYAIKSLIKGYNKSDRSDIYESQ